MEMFMKKEYSLDYTIERDVDRLAAVETILDNMEKKPTAKDLELMASYILYGKDENGQNAVQRKEVTDSNKRYNSFKRTEDRLESLDAILENPLADQQSLKPATERYIYTKKTTTISREDDADIPGMRELWDSIDRIDHIIKVNEGKVDPDPSVPLIPTTYRLYQLKHMLIDLRRHQYYLKDAYKPQIHFLNLTPPTTQTIDWDSDSAYWISPDEKHTVREHTFDWENPEHIRYLINNYSGLYMQLYDKPYSWGRTLLFDFDRYFDMCGFSPAREYIVLRRIDGATNLNIAHELEEKYGIKYNENHICSILTNEIPTKMAKEAKKHRLLLETPMKERKQCWTCKKMLPRDRLFFVRNISRADGWSSNCKECERKRRIQTGGQTDKDARNKDKSMYEV